MNTDLARFVTPRLLLLFVMSFLLIQGALLLGLRILASEFTDVAHPILHFVTGLVGIGLYRRPAFLFRYGLVFGTGYFALGVFGALGLVDPLWLPLSIVDHVFHFTLSSFALLVAAAGIRTHTPTPTLDPS